MILTLRTLLKSPPQSVLLQQPEAHLHPLTQANLAQLMANSAHQFIVESHSDFIINRLSICIRKQWVDARDIGLLWREKTGVSVSIHEFRFDEDGNMLDEYRELFNQETDDFLGVE